MTEHSHEVRAFIQARMSSSRYPGKVLAPLNGVPVIDCVVRAVAEVFPAEATVILTSTAASDDPLAFYLERAGHRVFRGDLDDVFGRFRSCLDDYPCDWFARVCADSPVLDSNVLRIAVERARQGGCDLVSNTFPRTFPKGQSVEIVRADAFRTIDPASLTAEEKEHVTAVFYRRAETMRIVNLRAAQPVDPETSMACDTIDDLRRLSTLATRPRFPVAPLSSSLPLKG